MITMPKHEHITMIRSLFKIMVQGVYKDRLMLLMNESVKSINFKKLQALGGSLN